MEAVLGLGGSGHDWSSCALRGDQVVAIDEERLTRRKYGVGSDLLAGVSRRTVLDAVGADPRSVRHVVACDLVPRSFTHAFRDRVVRINHHLAHAYSTFAASGFAEAAILVCDNAGSLQAGSRVGGGRRLAETVSYFRGGPEGISLLDRVAGEHYVDAPTESAFFQPGSTDDSLGQFYRSASLAIGLSYTAAGGGYPVSEDGKTMGLAPYGDERFVDDVAELVALEPGGRIALSAEKCEQRFAALLEGGDFDAKAALARAAQEVLERALLHCARHLYERTGAKYLCIAGGVGLNSVANGRILRETPFEKVFVVPAAGDNGISLGCAYYAAHELAGVPMNELPALGDAYLGPEYPEARVRAAISVAGLTVEPCDDLSERVAGLLADGALIGWYDGRSEFGPRALGHRSILAAPFPASVRDKLNDEVKFREWFRPFAPIVPVERAAEYFEIDQDSPFMLVVAKVRRPDEIPGVTHVDGTARLQTLERDVNPRLYSVLEHFAARTGTPVLLNTSYNVAGQPIVETPEEAVTAFVDMKLDYLVIGGRLIRHP
ncbi:MAG TPA: carbamoyltransferase C-terminal domain-containing protein [Actinospica sp.]|jgi:carbamoyltransferase|nr:carbamoyltransferase C-terminal domain-containing protein [Actinospica sp.]